MFRTAFVTTSTDNTNVMPSVVTEWQAARFGALVPAVTLTRVHRLMIDVSAACWLMVRRHPTVQADIFYAQPGDAVAVPIADAGQNILTTLGAPAISLAITRADATSPVSLRITGEVT